MTIKSRIKLQTFPIIYCLAWLLLFIPFDFFHRHTLSNYTSVAWGSITTTILTGIAIAGWIKSKREITISFTDILVGGMCIYVVLNTLLVRPVPAPDLFWLKFTAIVSVYIATRLSPCKIKERSLLIIVLAGVAEAVIILLQQYGLVERNHLLFTHTGTFLNPGPAGGFLACSFTILLYLLTRDDFYKIKKILLACIPVFIYSLFLTDSRAGWLAALSGTLFIGWNADFSIILSVKGFIRKSPFYKVAFLVFLLFTIGFLYQYKKGSSDGRLFIWRNSIEMVVDKPLAGHGTGMFRSSYPYYQAAYFADNPGSEFAMVAGNPDNPFNEFISVLTTQGLIGFIFLLTILFTLFLYRTDTNTRKQKAFLLAYCVFAFFSYPTHYFRLFILLPFFIAILPGRPVISSRKVGLFLIPVCFAGLVYSCVVLNRYQKLEEYYESHTVTGEKMYERIKYDRRLLEQYFFFAAHHMDEQQQFSIMKDYVELYPSPQGLCELGKKYREANQFRQAEECFIFASHINPSLITPGYELFLLYQAEGNPEKMRSTGEALLRQPLKKESTLTLKMKAYVRKVLEAF